MKKIIILLYCMQIVSLYSMKKSHTLEVLKEGMHIKISKGVTANIPIIAGMVFKAQIEQIKNKQNSKTYLVKFNNQRIPIKARKAKNLKVGDHILFGQLENSTDFVEM